MPSLLSPPPAVEPNFSGGSHSSYDFVSIINAAYNEVIHWKGNLFSVPYGSCGKAFVSELSRLIRAYAERSSLESVALTTANVACVLLLQCPNPHPKPHKISSSLSRQLIIWKDGLIEELLDEGRTIQHQLSRLSNSNKRKPNLTRNFSKMMFQGKIKDAIRLLNDKGSGEVSHCDDSVPTSSGNVPVVEVLKQKHPPAQPLSIDSVIFLIIRLQYTLLSLMLWTLKS